MDANVNPGPATPDPTPSRPHDIAEPGPIDPATGQPDHGAEVTELTSWFRQNAVSLVLTTAAVAAVCIWLDPIDTLKVMVGLGFIIFIHELGHFAAAKLCDVHVRTFSIGFGPAVPFCSYKWGETTYMIGIVPLGGYVAMVGEGDEEGDEEGEEDPRSFRKKSVGQRMFIISMGVVMNVILGMACFAAAYLHGVPEKPATVGYVESGGAAWRAGLRTGDRITMIGGRQNPFFDDIRPKVMSSSAGAEIPIAWDRTEPDGTVRHFDGTVSPVRDEGQRFPQIGVAPPYQLTLISGNKRKVKPVRTGTPAAESAAGGQTFEPGDAVVRMSDPDVPGHTPTAVKGYEDYYRRMVRLAAEPVVFEVRRKDSSDVVALTVKPAYRHDLGMRMQMGEVAAVRAGGPAEKAGVVALADGPQPTHGDKIKAVLLPPGGDGKRTWYVAGPVDWDKDEFKIPGVDPKKAKEQVKELPLDPVLLPAQLNQWADQAAGDPVVELVVLREENHTEVAKRFPVPFDRSYRFDRESAQQPNSPLPVGGLGLAYRVQTLVTAVAEKKGPGSPSTAAFDKGVRAGDRITAVRFKTWDEAGGLKEEPWRDDLKGHQWASADTVYQWYAPELDVKVERNGESRELTLTGDPDPDQPLDDRGLIFQSEVEVQRAADVGDAMRLGAFRTGRFIQTVYMNLYGYVKGRISVKTLSGPLTIANVSYKLAGEDFWQFLLFLGMISVNLAVVNFLPIPVLDGGHMVFLIVEKAMGRPVPDPGADAVRAVPRRRPPVLRHVLAPVIQGRVPAASPRAHAVRPYVAAGRRVSRGPRFRSSRPMTRILSRRRRWSTASLGCAVGAVALLLSSCGKKVALPPALDRDSFFDETGVKLPKETEFLSSTTSADGDGAIFTSLMLKMPKGGESLFSPTANEVPPSNAVHQLTLNQLSQLGVKRKDPKAPMRLRSLAWKTRGDGSLTFVPDGDLIYVECSFRLPGK